MRSGFRAAMVLGATSEKISTTRVRSPAADGNGTLATKADGDDGRQRGCQDVDEVVAEQDQADQAVGLAQKAFCQSGSRVTGIRKVAQPVTVERHQRGLRAGKEAGQNQKEGQGAEQGAER